MTNDQLTNDPKFEVSILFGQNYNTDAHVDYPGSYNNYNLTITEFLN
jgi:hypothetical protein